MRRALQAAEGWLALGAAQAACEELASLDPAWRWHPAVLDERARTLVAMGEVAQAKDIVRCLARLAPAWRLALLDDPALELVWS